MTTTAHVTIYGESTIERTWMIVDDSDVPVDLTGHSLAAHVRNGEAMVTTWDLVPAADQPGVGAGILTAILPAAKIATLRAASRSRFRWDLRMTTPNGTISYPINESLILVKGAVTVG